VIFNRGGSNIARLSQLDVFDIVRSGAPDDFLTGAQCVGTNVPPFASGVSVSSTPASGRVQYYLGQIENNCPGLLWEEARGGAPATARPAKSAIAIEPGSSTYIGNAPYAGNLEGRGGGSRTLVPKRSTEGVYVRISLG
jgi:hypothetical protein